MTATAIARRQGGLSVALIATSIIGSVSIALAMDAMLIGFSTGLSPAILAGALLFNATAIVQSLVGGIIEWRRPGHAIGRLMMLAGPLYGIVSAGWTTAETLEPLIDPAAYLVVGWIGALVSWPAVALVAGWIPVLFPTGTLPGPRWRAPAVVLAALTSIGLVALAFRPGPIVSGRDYTNPFGLAWWPGFLQPFADGVPFAVLGTLLLAMAAVIARYRRGDRIERVQIKWFVAAVAIVPLSLLAVLLEVAIRTWEPGGEVPGAPNALVSVLLSYAGILAMPIAIGIAVTRHRLYEIDRLISRTIGWTLTTGVLVLVFAGTVVGLQAILARVTQGGTLAVAASTLLAFAMFQPLRRRVQTAVDHRFDRARYDGDRTAAAFTERLQDRVDLAGLEAEITGVVGTALRPTTVAVWIRQAGRPA